MLVRKAAKMRALGCSALLLVFTMPAYAGDPSGAVTAISQASPESQAKIINIILADVACQSAAPPADTAELSLGQRLANKTTAALQKLCDDMGLQPLVVAEPAPEAARAEAARTDD